MDASPPPPAIRPSASASASAAPPAASSAALPTGHCPPDMVKVDGRYCVDRWELSAVDEQGRQASPYYPILEGKYQAWIDARRAEADKLEATDAAADARGAGMPFPELPDWQKNGSPKFSAVSKPGVIPNAYLSMYTVRDACVRASKRLCTLKEWQTACRGEKGTHFPYGDEYKAGKCNVFREEHPGHLLFGQFTVGMLDPRMDLVPYNGKPLLRKTGETPECKSVWGEDAIYDMNGNLDEWIDDPGGTFAGGFFSRNSKKGCEQVLDGHPAGYMDYSLGGRCCRDLIP